jgi:polyisoprenoid-binding protein YceI
MAPSGQLTAPALQALLTDATLAGNWSLDEATSTIGLRSRSMWGLAPVKGVFHRVSGQGTVTAAGEVSGTVTVDAASIDTKMKKRDAHLRSPELFDSGTYSGIVFTVTGVEPSADGVVVSGRLTVRDQTRPVSFAAQVSAADGGNVWFDAEVSVNRADFGLTWNQLGMASMQTTVTVHAVFSKR